jgi:hypothetical protein
VITEDKLREALDIERGLYTDDSGSAQRRRNRVMACR